MRQPKYLLAGLALGLLLSLSGGTSAQMPGDIPPQVLEQLKLTDKQKNELKEIRLSMEKERIGQQAEMRIKRLELEALMEEEKPNLEKIYQKVEEIGKIQTKILKGKIESILKIKSILTKEQQGKLKKLRERQGQPRRPQPQGKREKAPLREGPGLPGGRQR